MNEELFETTPGDPVDLFEWSLRSGKPGKAPNGMIYRLVPSEMVVERYAPGQLGDRIVGFSGQAFERRHDMIYWAVADGRHVFENNKPLSERKLIA